MRSAVRSWMIAPLALQALACANPSEPAVEPDFVRPFLGAWSAQVGSGNLAVFVRRDSYEVCYLLGCTIIDSLGGFGTYRAAAGAETALSLSGSVRADSVEVWLVPGGTTQDGYSFFAIRGRIAADESRIDAWLFRAFQEQRDGRTSDSVAVTLRR